MNHRSAVLALALFQTTLTLAQPNRPLNPPYLSEMPPVDRVLREIRANDPQETAARQMGAFIQFGRMIADMSGGRRDLTPDEQSIRKGYQAARAAIQNTLKEDLARALRGYDTNASFRDELFNRFFSPAFRAQYNSITAATNARIQAPVDTPVAANSPSPAAPAPTPAAAPKPAAAKTPPPPSPPDPSIVKARAAGVDTKVFGIPLGEPLALKECNLGDLTGPSANCLVKGGITELAAAFAGALIGDAKAFDDNVNIELASGNCPAWMTSCMIAGLLDHGRLVAVVLETRGREVEAAVGKELRGKYGQRASMQQRFITPNNGAREFQVWDLDWELPGLHVEYKVVADVYTAGSVRIESERLYQNRKEQIKEAAKPKL